MAVEVVHVDALSAIGGDSRSHDPHFEGLASEKNDGKWSTEVVAVFSRLPLNGNDIVGSEDRWWGVFLVNRLYTS